MKLASRDPLAWAAAALAVLLLVLALAALNATRRIANDATLFADRALPGFAQAKAIRSLVAHEWAATLGLSDAPPTEIRNLRAAAGQRDAEMQRSIALARAAFSTDATALETLRRLEVTQTALVVTRERAFARIEAGKNNEGRRIVQDELAPRLAALESGSDELMARHATTEATVASRLTAAATRMQTIVFAVSACVMLALLFVTVSVRRRMRQDRAIRETEEKLALAFRVSPHSMVISRREDGRVLAANEVFRSFYGVTGDAVGRSAVELGVWDSPAQRDTMLRELAEAGRVVSFVHRRPQPDGSERVLLISAEAVKLQGEDCLLAVGQDVTGRVQAEQALARSEAELRTIVENAAIGIALSDAGGHTLRCNSALEKLLGYRADELRQLSFLEFTHPAEVERDRLLYQELVTGERDSYSGEKRFLRKDGAEIWAHRITSAVRDDSGALLFVIAMVEDITARKRSELALREAEAARDTLRQQVIVAQKLEALGQLAGGVAHDFNNMLAAIMLYLDALRMETDLSPPMRRGLDELVKTARRAAGLTRQLLLFARREPAQRQLVEIDHVVTNLLQMLARLVGSNYQLVHTRAAEASWVKADPGMLEQVVMNLVVNARDAQPSGGEITLRTDHLELDTVSAAQHRQGRPGTFVRLTITDSGCGMSRDVLTRLFEPFFTTKPAGKGTGLGLSTVFGIVEQHRGWITVESEVGKGSSFSVFLPAHAAPTTEPAVPVSRSPTKHGHETIVLAEDDAQLRSIATRILETAGYTVLPAEDGAAAKVLLHEHAAEVDLLLTDIVMPGGIMGYDLLTALPENCHPKVILMSAYTSEIDFAALEAAEVSYLSKPFDRERLLSFVRAVLDGQPTEAALPLLTS